MKKISTRKTQDLSDTGKAFVPRSHINAQVRSTAKPEGLSFSLTLTHSLLCRWLVLSPTASFLSNSGKKRGKDTPQGPDGSLTSFVLLQVYYKPLNVALSVLLSRLAAHFSANAGVLSSTVLFFHHWHKSFLNRATIARFLFASKKRRRSGAFLIKSSF